MTMKQKNGHAIFTAECSHSFHFNCIASNLTHGNRVCPVCQASWKEVPAFQGMPSQQGRFNPYARPPFQAPPKRTHSRSNVRSRFQAQEPSIFDDDEPVINKKSEEMHFGNSDSDEAIEIKTFTELPAVPKSEKFVDFGILLNLKATKEIHSRTPIDLVTILDTSSSMMGTKIDLLKKAMAFVVQNLNPLDRLSVISFSSSARRVFPLRRMTEIGKQESIRMIHSLVANGGTNIAEALKKGSKVMTDRKFKNPVSGMILLSDGHDTCKNWWGGGGFGAPTTGAYGFAPAMASGGFGAPFMGGGSFGAPAMGGGGFGAPAMGGGGFGVPATASGGFGATPLAFGFGGAATGVHTFGTSYREHLTLPNTYNNQGHLTFPNTRNQQGHLTLSNTGIPIHTFGFGADHDANLLHSISEQTGGMFSFIETESVIQDAFAQCIGGLLSVVVQELRVEVECVHPVLRLGSIKAGSFKVGMDSNGRRGFIEVGELYAEEERDFLVSMDIPAVNDSNYEMPLVKFRVIYKDPIKNKFVTIEGNEVTILRPHTVLNRTVSPEVARQRNRLNVASAIADARVAAEHGNLTEARSTLGDCQKQLLLLGSALGEDEKCGLDEELEEMREGMANPIAYGSRGRAYMLSGLDAHSKQRATARGDSTKLGCRKRTYQTSKMAIMLKKSQKM